MRAQVTDALYVAALLAVAAYFLVPLYSSRMIPEEDGQIFSGGSCWADLPIHMTIVNSFLSGRNQDVSLADMQSPVFAGERFSYPFIPDFHAAVLVKQGLSMRWAFLLPGVLVERLPRAASARERCCHSAASVRVNLADWLYDITPLACLQLPAARRRLPRSTPPHLLLPPFRQPFSSSPPSSHSSTSSPCA